MFELNENSATPNFGKAMTHEILVVSSSDRQQIMGSDTGMGIYIYP